jgi:hypothetical protein
MLLVSHFQASSSVKEMQSFREKLPAFKMRTEFLKAVAENQVHFSFTSFWQSFSDASHVCAKQCVFLRSLRTFIYFQFN